MHPMYVVKRTALANEYARDEFKPISEKDYIEMVVETIKLLPKETSIQRISAGIDDDSLIAPIWCKNKQKRLDNIRKSLREIGLKY